MSQDRQALGRWGEQAACAFLQGQGLKVVATNVRTPVGEIDLLCRQGQTRVFVEVKTRRSTQYGGPAEAVNLRKQRQIIRAAQWYLAEAGETECEIRFDVVAVALDQGQLQIEHIPAAFEQFAD